MLKVINWSLKTLDGIGAVAVIFMMISTTADVFSRQVLGKPLVGVIELNRNLLVFVAFLALGYAQVFKQHVRSEMLLERLTPRSRWLTELFELIFALIIMVFITYGSIGWAYKAVQTNERALGLIPFPLWPGRIALALGCISLSVQFLVESVHYIRHPQQPIKAQKRTEIV